MILQCFIFDARIRSSNVRVHHGLELVNRINSEKIVGFRR